MADTSATPRVWRWAWGLPNCRTGRYITSPGTMTAQTGSHTGCLADWQLTGCYVPIPRYLKYWEQQVRDKYLQTQSQSSLANKTGQYYQAHQGTAGGGAEEKPYRFHRRPDSGGFSGTVHIRGGEVL
ncbi:hypothetical protein NXW09_29590 [Bacteroides ovatus]|nr:hypothetical protein [Bacteroides ovatus]